MKIIAQKPHGFVVEIPDGEMHELLEQADADTERLRAGATINLREVE